MLTEAAVLWEPGGIWEVGPVELDPPVTTTCWSAWWPPGCATPTSTS
jgi:hypothetical protein